MSWVEQDRIGQSGVVRSLYSLTSPPPHHAPSSSTTSRVEFTAKPSWRVGVSVRTDEFACSRSRGKLANCDASCYRSKSRATTARIGVSSRSAQWTMAVDDGWAVPPNSSSHDALLKVENAHNKNRVVSTVKCGSKIFQTSLKDGNSMFAFGSCIQNVLRCQFLVQSVNDVRKSYQIQLKLPRLIKSNCNTCQNRNSGNGIPEVMLCLFYLLDLMNSYIFLCYLRQNNLFCKRRLPFWD